MKKSFFKTNFFSGRNWKKSHLKRLAAQLLLSLGALHYPEIGHCNSDDSLLKKALGSLGTNTRDVATRIAEIRDNEGAHNDVLEFSPDGRLVALRSSLETIRIWDWQNDRFVVTLNTAQGANSGLTSESIRYSPDGKLLAACHDRANNGTVIRIWSTGTWKVTQDIVDPLPGGCSTIGFSPDGKQLLMASRRMTPNPGDSLTVFDTNTWRPSWGLATVPFRPNTLVISPDGRFVAIGGSVLAPSPVKFQEQIVIVDLSKRAVVRTIPNTVSFRHGSLAWSVDGKSLAAAGSRSWDISANQGQGGYISGPETVLFFDVETGEKIAAEQWGDLDGFSVRFSPNGKYFIEGNQNGEGTGLGVRIWDGQRRELLQEIPGNARSLAVSKDSRFLAIGGDKKKTIWALK